MKGIPRKRDAYSTVHVEEIPDGRMSNYLKDVLIAIIWQGKRLRKRIKFLDFLTILYESVYVVFT